MAGSRTERRERSRAQRRRLLAPAVVVVLATVVLAALAVAGMRMWTARASDAPAIPAASAEAAGLATASAEATTPVAKAAVEVLVEVPDVVGKPYDAAALVMSYAGFPVVSEGTTASAEGTPVVVTQNPVAGTRLARGEQITLSTAPAGSPKARTIVVVIDPGHQSRADLAKEPVGPGSRLMKEKVTAGTVGVATKRSETQVARELSARVGTRLKQAGIRVYFTRTTDDVRLSNAERARMAGGRHADLFLRLHADGVTDGRVRGVSVLYPEGNEWVSRLAVPSKRAALSVDRALVAATKAPDRGLAGRSDLAGFNWATCPSILVEAGVLSNAQDDALLADPVYLDRLADGIAGGVLDYFGR
jgi:N-acetylmuramoyl-L-alanine amidase